MSKIRQVWQIVKSIYEVLTPVQRRKSISAFFAMIIASIFELLGVTLIVPFVTAIMTEDALMKNKVIYNLASIFGITNSNGVILLMAGAVVITYLVKNLVLLYTRYIQNKYCREINTELSVTMLSAYVARPYEFFVNTNTSEIMRGVNNDVESFFQIMQVLFGLAAEMFTVLLIVIFVFMTDFVTAISVLLLSGGVILAITYGTKGTTARVANKKRDADDVCGRALLELLGGIKDIFVTQTQKKFLARYEKASKDRQKSILIQEVVLQIPERVIEFALIGGIIIIVSVRVVQGYDTDQYIPQLSALAVACFRLLPSLNKVTSAFNQVIFHYPGMANVHSNITEARKILEQKSLVSVGEDNGFEEFEDAIVVNGINWKYLNSTDNVLDTLNIRIEKGESVAFIGKSGAGKTTLADVILGLLHPQKGDVLADGRDIFKMPAEWAKHIGYVPQSVFLIDDTIRANVAFGYESDEINDERVWSALRDAQLDEFVKNLPNGIDTIVGERGVKFSGGQRQRIAIARVMYYDPEILVFDEATSALDDGTEQAVMEAINSLQGRKTMIIIAHRLSTIRNCDRVYEIADGKAVECDKDEYK